MLPTIQVQTKPMPHQQDALAKLLSSRLGAAFMDMGTGKSLVAIFLAANRLARGKIERVVWFTPVSLKDNVRREILKHTGTDQHTHVFNDKTSTSNLPHAFWYIVGLESMGSSNRTVLAANLLLDCRTMVIVDESGYIKGHRAKRTKRITTLSAACRYRLIMTGTPLSQGVVDLFAQMKFLSPKILGYHSFGSFAKGHLEYSKHQPGRIIRSHNTEELAEKIRPFVYQVTKDECLDLPEKQYVHRHCLLTREQENAYERAKSYYLTQLDLYDDEDDSWGQSLKIFRLFLALQQIASGFENRSLTKERHFFRHRRLQLLLDVVGEIAPDEPIIIWAKYLHDIAAISTALADAFGADQVCEYHGQLSTQQRNANEQRFHQGARFFVGTPSSGGHGLTLTEARYVVFYNNSFKYAERIQAEDRAHRIGQTRVVIYICLWAECGIENRIYAALEKKADALEDFRAEVEKVKEQKESRLEILKKIIKNL